MYALAEPFSVPPGTVLDILVRVSRTGDRDKLRSPDDQERAGRRFVEAIGGQVGQVHRAIDQTGRKRDNPWVELAKERALAGITGGFVAAYVSRFVRNVRYGLETVDELIAKGKFFGSPDCPFDLRTAEGRRYLTDKMNEAQYEGDVKAAHFAAGVQGSIEDGVHLMAVYGYRKSNGPASPLEPVDGEHQQVLRAFKLRGSGSSWPAIAKALNASGAQPRPYKRDGLVRQARWTHKTVRQLVLGGKGKGNEVYLGVAWNGSHRREGAHPAIPGLTREIYRAAVGREKGTKPLGPDEGYLLSGLVRCASCGYVMIHAREPDGRRYYRCRPGQRGEGCDAPASCPAEPLEQLAWQRFEQEYCGDAPARQVVDTRELDAAEERFAEAKLTYERALEAEERASSEAALEIAQRRTNQADAALVQAGTALELAKVQARATQLPERMTVEEAREYPVDERRHWLSLVYVVTVRKARRWREDVADRCDILGLDDLPADGTRLRLAIAGQAD